MGLEEENPAMGGALWYPGKPIYRPMLEATSARSKEIAKKRAELLSLLVETPEGEFELSLTDLVEAVDNSVVVDDGLAGVKVKRRSEEVAKTPPERRGMGSNGVLLNLYLPVSLRRSSSICSSASDHMSLDGMNNKRRDERPMQGCWSAMWKRRGRSARPERRCRASILSTGCCSSYHVSSFRLSVLT